MRRVLPFLLAAGLALPTISCVTDSGGCPRPGLDTARRCKRLCVLRPNQLESPLPCSCMDQCLCWQMPGHSRRPSTSEDLEPE